MRVISNKNGSPSVPARAGGFALVCAALALAGCGGPEKPIGTVGHVTGFGGVVSADEPQAVLAARDVLSAGGNAADAAVTLYFSLAVTLPSTASLGGGGSCVVYDSERKASQVIDFPSVAGIPANARGIYALHSKFGKLRWESLMIAPERLARNGVMVSRAFANDLGQRAKLLSADANARKLFFKADGKVLAEGDQMENFDLAAVLASLRRAPGDFYSGTLAREMAASSKAIGAGFSVDDLRDLRPKVSDGNRAVMGDDVVVVSGEAADTVSAMLKNGVTERLQQVSAASTARSKAAGTSFVILDHNSNSVVCALGSNGMFGSGRILPGTGIVLAAPASTGQSLAAGMVINQNSREVHFGGAASGGVSPASAIAAAMVAGVDRGEKAEATLTAAAAGLPTGSTSRLNAFACQTGSPSAATCSVATDSTGFGYAVTVGWN